VVVSASCRGVQGVHGVDGVDGGRRGVDCAGAVVVGVVG
jgi:hypothetical protein